MKIELTDDEEIAVAVPEVSTFNKFTALENLPVEPFCEDQISCDSKDRPKAALSSDTSTQTKEIEFELTEPPFNQTEENPPSFVKCKPFVPYPCFYCGKVIKSRSCLSVHIKECKSLPNYQNMNIRNLDFKVLSDQNSIKSDDPNSAINVYHSLLSALQNPTFRKLPCDKCNEVFESENVLELHMMFSHNGFGHS